MDTNTKVQINWGVINIPTILAVGAVFVTLVSTWTRMDSRVTAIETSRLQRSTEINKVIEQLTQRTLVLDNLAYRLTIVEQGVADVNRRADRINESVSARLDKFQESISALITKVEVQNQLLQSVLPADKPPKELR